MGTPWNSNISSEKIIFKMFWITSWPFSVSIFMNLLRFRPTLTDSLTCFFRFPPGLRRSSTGKVRKPLVILQMKHQRETLWVTWLQRPNVGEDPKIGRYRMGNSTTPGKLLGFEAWLAIFDIYSRQISGGGVITCNRYKWLKINGCHWDEISPL